MDIENNPPTPQRQMTEQEKLKSIINDYDVQIDRHEKEVEDLRSKILFYTAHNLQEEYRIANIKLGSIELIVYRWRSMYNHILDLYKQSLTKTDKA